MTDLTKITTPFGLLDQATQDALQAGGLDVQEYCGDDLWAERDDDGWHDVTVYRVKPTPPAAREWWVLGNHIRESLAEAERFRADVAHNYGPHHLERPIIHVREVMPDE